MGLRPARCYSDPSKDRAYTRIAVRVHKRNYIGAVPGLKTRQFNMGNPEKEYNTLIDLICLDNIIIRDNALESIRMLVNRKLVNLVGKDSFYMKLRMYPFHILRENKQAQGAHADRIQTGMSHAFGKSIGRAVRARKNQVIFSVLIDSEQKEKVKEILKKAKSRLPCKVKIKENPDLKSIGTKPRKKKRMQKTKEDKEENKEQAKDKKEETKEEKKK